MYTCTALQFVTVHCSNDSGNDSSGNQDSNSGAMAIAKANMNGCGKG